MRAYALQLKNKKPYEQNLKELLDLIATLPKDALIVAPEVCLTDYDYGNLDEACKFSEYALKELLKVIDEQILALTMLLKEDGKVVNKAVVLHKGKVVHTQNKAKLFKPGNEHHYLEAGREEDIKIFEINGIKFGLLICFELRFKELWLRLEGADIILLPAQWGLPRKHHLEVLPNALAIMNQCFVVVSNSSKEDMASSSAIYTPMGGQTSNDYARVIENILDFKERKFMRRYLPLE